MKFPIWMTVIFIFISLIVNVGTVANVVQEDNASIEEKGMRLVVSAVNTPNNIDDFLSQSIDKATGAEEPTEQRIYAGLSVFALIAFIAVLAFFYKILRWFLGLALDLSGERQTAVTFIFWIVALTLLTWGWDSMFSMYNFVAGATGVAPSTENITNGIENISPSVQ